MPRAVHVRVNQRHTRSRADWGLTGARDTRRSCLRVAHDMRWCRCGWACCMYARMAVVLALISSVVACWIECRSYRMSPATLPLRVAEFLTYGMGRRDYHFFPHFRVGGNGMRALLRDRGRAVETTRMNGAVRRRTILLAVDERATLTRGDKGLTIYYKQKVLFIRSSGTCRCY